MENELPSLDVSKKVIPEDISFAKVNKTTGKVDTEDDNNVYFELFLNENINF